MITHSCGISHFDPKIFDNLSGNTATRPCRQPAHKGGGTNAHTPALLDIVAPTFFRPGIDPHSSLYQNFRAALAALPTDRLRESIVPMGRITFGREDFMARLGELDGASTLVMCGDQDVPRPPKEAREMAESIGCPWVLVPQAGHSSLENP